MEEMSCPDQKMKSRNRGSNFSTAEKGLLLHLVASNQRVVSKKTDKITTLHKNRAWEEITAELNAANLGCKRTVAQVKICWKNQTSKAKKEFAAKKKVRGRTNGQGDHLLPSEMKSSDSDDDNSYLFKQATPQGIERVDHSYDRDRVVDEPGENNLDISNLSHHPTGGASPELPVPFSELTVDEVRRMILRRQLEALEDEKKMRERDEERKEEEHRIKMKYYELKIKKMTEEPNN